MSTTIEEVERERAAIEGEEDPELEPAEAQEQKGELFDRSQYEREDLRLDKVDGNQVDRISLKFSGTVFLDRSDPNDIALYRRLVLGRDVTLQVEGRCNATAAKGATDREGDLDVVVGEKGIKVTTVYIAVADGIE